MVTKSEAGMTAPLKPQKVTSPEAIQFPNNEADMMAPLKP